MPRHPIRIGAAFWLQRTGWPELRDAALACEAAGFDSLWADDHLLSDEGDWRDAKLEGWSVLAAWAVLTERIRLGLLVGANTFRSPGLTAKLATTLDHLSGGRAILGLGAGWFEREHDAYGLDFGASMGERIDRLAESLGIMRRLLDGERFSHEGRFYRLHDALCAPAPIQPRLPVLVGGSGPRKTLPLVARLADIWNTKGTPTEVAASDQLLRAECAALGRDPEAIERSVYLTVFVRDDPAEADAALRASKGVHGVRADQYDLVTVTGDAEGVAERLRGYVEVGFRHHIWVFRSPFDHQTMAAMPEVRRLLRA
ncbi:MAG TPA: TIGR03560 family F420-dependent LLM class oxidoreductase [Candidatus Limnocylindrales bacterium]|nr:TIGR03560 family F420-dependent LLM class oxidoreductase [Candidatus Limnocylindrales bacterium]